LVGAQDVGDLHQVVVDDIGKMVGRVAVGLDGHKVVQFGQHKVQAAADGVVPADRLGRVGDAKTQDVRAVKRSDLLTGQAKSVVLEGAAGGLGLGAKAVQPLGRAPAAIERTGGQ